MKLQYMMQSQWNEAVQMLATTPQRKVCINTEILEKILCTTDMFFCLNYIDVNFFGLSYFSYIHEKEIPVS